MLLDRVKYLFHEVQKPLFHLLFHVFATTGEIVDHYGNGILLIAIYPGHEEGDAEGKEVCEYLSTLDRRTHCVTQVKILNSPTSPYFMIIETKEERK